MNFPLKLRANHTPKALPARLPTSMSAQTASTTKYAFLGNQIPPIGLGMAALGRPGYINLGHSDHLVVKDVEGMRSQAWKVLDAAYASGVRYFDCARSYGLAEDFVASWLTARGFKPGDLVIGSKWGYYYTADWQIDTGGRPHEVKDHSAAHLRKQSEESDKLLGRWLNLYQIHSATLESGVLSDPEVIEELWRIKRERSWKIGLSVSGPKQPETITLALSIKDPASNQLLFDSVQATWNLLEQSAGPALSAARAAGLSVIVKEGMANGRLLSDAGLPHLTERVRAVAAAARELGTTADSLALAAVAAQGFSPMVLSGAATVPHLESNAAGVFGGLADSLRVGGGNAAVLERLMGVVVQEPERYWADRSGLSWN